MQTDLPGRVRLGHLARGFISRAPEARGPSRPSPRNPSAARPPPLMPHADRPPPAALPPTPLAIIVAYLAALPPRARPAGAAPPAHRRPAAASPSAAGGSRRRRFSRENRSVFFRNPRSRFLLDRFFWSVYSFTGCSSVRSF